MGIWKLQKEWFPLNITPKGGSSTCVSVDMFGFFSLFDRRGGLCRGPYTSRSG